MRKSAFQWYLTSLLFAFLLFTTREAQSLSFDSVAVNMGGFKSGGRAIGDINNDGKLDIVTTSNSDDGVTDNNQFNFVLGNGDGTFGTAVMKDMLVGNPNANYTILLTDVNNDTKLDVIESHGTTARSFGDKITICQWNGSSFDSTTTLTGSGSISAIATCDFDSDGKVDIACEYPDGSTMNLYWGNGDATFTAPTAVALGVPLGARCIRVADLDGDTRDDLVFSRLDGNAVSVIMGNGTRTVGTRNDYPVSGSQPYGIALADFNGDGKEDVVSSNGGDSSISYLQGNGDGTFGTASNYPIGLWFMRSIEAADFNNDGKMDIALGSAYNYVTVRLGNGDGTFGSDINFNVYGTSNYDIGIGDLNNDGLVDMVSGNHATSDIITVFINTTGVPIGDWLFLAGIGGTAFDSSTNNLNGALYNSPLWVSMPPAIDFDGADDYVMVPDAAPLDITAGITMSVWVKRDRTGWGSDEYIMGKAKANENSYSISIAPGNNVKFMIANSGPMPNNFTSTGVINDFDWHHITTTYDGATMKIYIDGSLDVSGGAASGSIYSGLANLCFGANGEESWGYFDGQIGHAMIFGSAFDTTLIHELFADDSVIFFAEYIPPDNDMTLTVTAIEIDRIALSWNPSAVDSLDADSVGIWFKTGSFPSSAYDGTLAGKYALTDSVDTVTGLTASTMYYFSLMVRDTNENWSDTAISACDSAKTFHPPYTIYVDKDATGANNGSSWANAFTDLKNALAYSNRGDNIWVAEGTYKPTTGVDRSIFFQMVLGISMYGGFSGTETSINERDWIAHPCTLSGDIGTIGDTSDNSYHVVFGADSTVIDGFIICFGNANGINPDDNGGGMRCSGAAYAMQIKNCTFSMNTASNWGGGLANNTNFTASIINCNFINNSAGSGGAIGNWESPSLSIISCYFEGNYASIQGGAIKSHNYSPSISNCTFKGNSADRGGGIFNEYSNSLITKCFFWDNSANYGGGIHNVGSYPLVINNIFSNNSATTHGGAVWSDSSTSSFKNCTFSENSANLGGAIFNWSSATISILNSCILWNDSASSGNEIYNDGGSANVTYSLIAGGYSGTGNISDNPLFVNANDVDGPDDIPFTSDDGLRLAFLSPGIDAGDPDSVFSNEPLPNGSRLNMGAYGNTSLATITDNTSPTIVSLSPVDNATGVGLNDSLVIIFSEVVNIGSGNITIKKSADNTVIEVISVGSANVTGGGTNTITIDPNSSLIGETGYYVLIDSTCFVDLAGNKFPGITSNTVWNFITIDTITDQPTLSAPSIGSNINDSFNIDFSIPENASSGSVKMSFLQTSGMSDPNSPHIITFVSTYETAGSHSTVLQGANLSHNGNISSVSSDPNDALVKDAVYSVIIEYQDMYGNGVAKDTSIGVLYTGGELGNDVNATLTNSGNNAVIVTLTRSNTPISSAAGIYFDLHKDSAYIDSSSALMLYYRDTTFVISNITTQGMWYGAWVLFDSLGNQGLMKHDSIAIGNIPPVLSIPSNTSLYEDSVWTIFNCASDANGDQVTLSLVSAPPDMYISQTNLSITWTPDNEDVGTHLVIVSATDTNGGVDTDSMSLLVLNTNDYPVISSAYFPDTVYEDSLLEGVISVSDPDDGDSVFLTLNPIMPWLSITLTQGNNDSLWQFTVRGIPDNANTGLIQFNSLVSDKEGLVVTGAHAIYVINTNDPPQTFLNKKDLAYGAVLYNVKGIDDFDTVLTFCATITDSANRYDTSMTNTSGLFPVYPLVDGRYIFSCYTKDKDGLKDLTPYKDTITVSNVTTHTWSDSGIWDMVSLPVSSYNAASFRSAGVILHWDESRNPSSLYKYYIRSDGINELTAGNSYWARLDNTVSVSLNKDSLCKDSVALYLHKSAYGWNQISSPYPYPVRWNKPATLWEWDPVNRDFIESTDGTMYPWHGYWVLTEAADTVNLSPAPVFVSKALSRQKKLLFENEREWTFGIELTSNINRDADNLFGVSRHARDGYDVLDRPEPPRMGNEPYLFFAHPEWKRSIDRFASDIRKSWDKGKNIFQIGISPCTRDVTALTLNITGFNEDASIYLFVNTSSGVVEYKPGKSLAIEPSNEEQYRTIFATADKDFLNNFPHKFILNNPYPNPCRPATTIRYTLPYNWGSNGWLNTKSYKVKMVIYDARGRVVRELVNRKQGPGNYKVVWRGKSDTGRRVASGFYFCRLIAGKHSSVKKIITIR